jgi:flagellar basal-body rod modification protein FlgD
MVSSVGSSPATNSTTTSNASQNTLRQQDFLKLMVAQMKNIDPLNPDSQQGGEFLTQMAQFRSTQSMSNMEASIEKLTSSLQSNQALQASALVGRKVLVKNSTMNLGAEGDVKASINALPCLKNLTASIYSSAGELIKTIPIDQPTTRGNLEFSWDGTDKNNERVNSGAYTLKVSGSYNGQTVSVPTMSYANVDSVTLGQNGDGLKLNVAGIGAVSLNDVLQISV